MAPLAPIAPGSAVCTPAQKNRSNRMDKQRGACRRRSWRTALPSWPVQRLKEAGSAVEQLLGAGAMCPARVRRRRQPRS
eukprot:10570443-Alexandrium_andersonii.AAC.1